MIWWEKMVVDNLLNPSGRSELIGEMTFVWTGKGRKASESLYQPKNTELFWTIFYISSTISLQYDRKGPEFLKIYKVRWSWVWSRGRNKFDIFLYFINMMVSLFNLPRQEFLDCDCYHSETTMVFRVTIAIEWMVWKKPLVPMVFKWFLVYQPLAPMVF